MICFAGFEKQAKNQYKKSIFFQCFHLSPLSLLDPRHCRNSPLLWRVVCTNFMAKCYPLPRIRTLSQGLAPSLPFSRDVLSQGMPFPKGLWQLTLLQGFYPFARISAGIFPFPKGCPKSSRAKVAVPFCKGFPFALRSILSQGLILAISLLQGTSFLKDCLWQNPFFKGHPFSRASLGNCPFARAILLQ